MTALFHREYGSPDNGRTVVFLHGLFGSSANWRGIARRFEGSHRVVIPDLRNHGQSPHAGEVSYAAQVVDVVELLDRLGIPATVLVGHSMGGKVAMLAALTHPDRVGGMVCVDIAPVDYPSSRFGQVFEAFAAVDPPTLESRQQADDRMAPYLPVRAVRSYMLQNLIKEESGWRWRLNLAALERGMAELSAFPAVRRAEYLGESLFVYGGNSPYVEPGHAEIIRRLFPYARLRQVVGAGHWVYADQPQAFANVLANFLANHESGD
jgi:esterase